MCCSTKALLSKGAVRCVEMERFPVRCVALRTRKRELQNQSAVYDKSSIHKIILLSSLDVAGLRKHQCHCLLQPTYSSISLTV